jgi:nucleoside-diphosphate-sugar epimerase
VIHAKQAYGDVRSTSAEISKIRDELGYKPAVALEEGLEAQVRWQTSKRAYTRPERGIS